MAAKKPAAKAADPAVSSDSATIGPGGLTVENMARVCHEANRSYCQALGDTSQPAWDAAPDWQRESAIAGVELHLGNPGLGVSASHDSWMAQKAKDGWTYGEVKDEKKKTHPCMVPFNKLPKEQQAKDFIFGGVMNGLRVLVGR